MTDAEVVELSRIEMQAIMDRSDFSAPTQEDLVASVGLPTRPVELFAADLTELGKFEVDLPAVLTAGQPKVMVDAMRRHWVYRHKDGKVITLQLSKRVRLRALGYVLAPGFVNDVGSRS